MIQRAPGSGISDSGLRELSDNSIGIITYSLTGKVCFYYYNNFISVVLRNFFEVLREIFLKSIAHSKHLQKKSTFVYILKFFG